jgi:hypothetical protein
MISRLFVNCLFPADISTKKRFNAASFGPAFPRPVAASRKKRGFNLDHLGLVAVYGLETLPQFGHNVRAFLWRKFEGIRIWACSEGRLHRSE